MRAAFPGSPGRLLNCLLTDCTQLHQSASDKTRKSPNGAEFPHRLHQSAPSTRGSIPVGATRSRLCLQALFMLSKTALFGLPCGVEATWRNARASIPKTIDGLALRLRA